MQQAEREALRKPVKEILPMLKQEYIEKIAA